MDETEFTEDAAGKTTRDPRGPRGREDSAADDRSKFTAGQNKGVDLRRQTSVPVRGREFWMILAVIRLRGRVYGFRDLKLSVHYGSDKSRLCPDRRSIREGGPAA